MENLALKKSDIFFRKIWESSADGMRIVDENGIILDVNDSFCRIFKIKKESLIGQNLSIIYNEANRKEILEQYLQDLKSGCIEALVTRETELWNGKIVITELSNSIFYLDKHTPLLLSIFRDITNQKEAEEALQQSLEFNRAVNENSPIGISVRSPYGKLLRYNKAWKRIWAMSDEDIAGDLQLERNELKFDSRDEYLNDYIPQLKKVYNEGGTVYVPEIKTNQKKPDAALWISQYFYALKDKKNNVERVVILTEDITEKKLKDEDLQKTLREKELMLSEIHHRVKNNLQIISSLLNMQSEYITNPDIMEYFRISSSRVKSMALIHENLYRSDDLSKINFEKYVRQLSTHLFNVYGADASLIRLSIKISSIFLNIDTAIPCGLLINELLSNSLKHAFPNNGSGDIVIEMMTQNDHCYTLFVSDSGIGLPQNIDIKKLSSLGMKLVYTLTNQLDGNIEYKINSGTKFIINFKDSNYKKRL